MLAETHLAAGNAAAAAAVLSPLTGAGIESSLDWQLQHLRMRILLAENRPQEALALSSNLQALAGGATDSRRQMLAESVAFQSQIFENLGRLADAVAVLTNGNVLANVSPERQRDAFLKIAELSLRLGRGGEARNALNQFLAANTNSPAADGIYVALGELDLRQYVAGAPITVITNSAITNRLQRASLSFDTVISQFPNSPLVGRALLGKGWCLWLDGDVTNSLSFFEQAARRLPFSEEQAVARFKWADAQLASGQYAAAYENYIALVASYAEIPSVKEKFLERALYQAARAALKAGAMKDALDVAGRILEWYPTSLTGDEGLMLAGQGYATQGDPARAREILTEIARRHPQSLLLPAVKLAIARSYELEGNWVAAVQAYEEWLIAFPNDVARPSAEFYRAWATGQAGSSTNALGLFTNYVVQFPSNTLAPAAQWWVADFYYRQQDFPNAEKSYKRVFQNWPASRLSFDARLMAGKAAVGREAHGEAIAHFTNLTSNLKTPPQLWTQAMFAYGDSLMKVSEEPYTNRQANLELARDVYNQIIQKNPTNETAARAWGLVGNCYFQLAAQEPRLYGTASNAYWQAMKATNAGVSTRSEAQVSLGLTLEKMAALKTGSEQQALLKAALANYLDVVYEGNLAEGETRDLFWLKEAGLKALPLVEAFGDWEPLEKLCRRLQALLPWQHDSLERRRIKAREQLAKQQ